MPPNVKDTDIGGNGFSRQYPFVLNTNPGRDDYIILLVGEAEKAKILLDSKDMLAQLCSFRIICARPPQPAPVRPLTRWDYRFTLRLENPFWITSSVSSASFKAGSSSRENHLTSAASLAAARSPATRRHRKSIKT